MLMKCTILSKRRRSEFKVNSIVVPDNPYFKYTFTESFPYICNEKKSSNVSKAFRELCIASTNFSRRGPGAHISDEDNIKYLYNATTVEELVPTALKQYQTSQPSWKSGYSTVLLSLHDYIKEDVNETLVEN